MPQEKPTYDLVLMLDPAAPEDRREQVISEVQDQIARQGEVLGAHDWGTRNMAYEIRHKGDADYHLIQFHGTPELLELLHGSLRITDGVVRFRIIKLDPGTPEPPASVPAATALSDED